MDNHYQITDIVEFCRENWAESDTDIHRYVLHLHRLSNLEAVQAERLMEDFGLSMTEFDLLATLRRSPLPHVLSPTELQRSTLLSSGGQTKVLNQLEARGLLARSVDQQDRRSKLVHLTEEGEALIEVAMAAVLELVDSRIEASAITRQELQQLTHLMGKLLLTLEGGA